jgi:uncharacterized protein (DUF1684 family)
MFIAVVVVAAACNTATDRAYISEIKAWQDTLNAEFHDPVESPLKPMDFNAFKSLDFYKIDPKYHIWARFIRTPGLKPFGMKTTTDRLPVYVKYGEAYFTVDGVKCKLNIYQNQELIKREGYEDYLFIPFLDKTSGKESYGGGRYLDLRIPHGDSILIDFNKAYNPYCAYNHDYSCPIPPYENTLKVEIRAGVKKFGH